MTIPFTAAEFIQVFTDYNAAIWPTQVLAYLLGALAVHLAVKGHRLGTLVIPVILAFLWAFTGIAYHLVSFARINPAARAFGAVFIVQAALLIVAGMRRRLHFRRDRGVHPVIGLALVAYAMIVYPMLGFLLGHGYPNGPVFGLTPCPLVIFTFGMLLLAERPPKHLIALPLLWALVGSTAAVAFGIWEDLGMLVAALLGSAMIVRGSPASRSGIPIAARTGP